MAADRKDFNGAELRLVPIGKIRIPEYQRAKMQGWAEDIAEHWDHHLFRHPYLMEAKGEYDCIDGQHTVLAAEIRGHADIPCYVLRDTPPQKAAAVFSDVNTRRKRLRPFNVWVADRFAGRTWAVQLDQIASRHGLEVADASGATKLKCVGQARTIIETHGQAVLDEALAVLTGAWSDPKLPENQSRCEAVLVVAMADLVRRSMAADRYDRERFIRKLRSLKFSRFGVESRLTPESFALSYVPSLIEKGSLTMPALTSGKGASAPYSRAFAIAIFGDGGKQLYQ